MSGKLMFTAFLLAKHHNYENRINRKIKESLYGARVGKYQSLQSLLGVCQCLSKTSDRQG